MPLVLAAADYLVPLYRETSTYPTLLPEIVHGNPEGLSPATLADRARRLVRAYLDSQLDRVVREFDDLAGLGRASSDLATVLSATHDGRVGVLLVADGIERWGTFGPALPSSATIPHS